MNESVAYVLTQMLRGVPKDQIGSAPAANIPQYSGYAGKTGSVAFGDGINKARFCVYPSIVNCVVSSGRL